MSAPLGDLQKTFYAHAPADLSQIGTAHGERCNSQKRLTNFDTAVPIYLLFENPVDSGTAIALQERKFKTYSAGADLQILWDYDVSTATKTPYPVFNEYNLYRGEAPAMEASILNPITDTSAFDWEIAGAATIVDEGIERESDFILTSGTGANSSGDISPQSGFRLYTPGTGFLVKLVSLANDNEVLFGYNWLEQRIHV